MWLKQDQNLGPSQIWGHKWDKANFEAMLGKYGQGYHDINGK